MANWFSTKIPKQFNGNKMSFQKIMLRLKSDMHKGEYKSLLHIIQKLIQNGS